METRKLLFTLGLVALFVTPVMAAPTNGAGYDGGSAYISRISGYFAGLGGEFSISGDDLLLTNTHYSSLAKGVAGAESFQTFCVERWVGVPPYSEQPVDLWVSTEFVGGGTPGSHAWVGNQDETGQDLASATAYLYTQFATGKLSNYDYLDTDSGTDSGRAKSALALQAAIWVLQEQITHTENVQANLWIEEAQNAIADGSWTGIGYVRIVQVYSGENEYQDVLYLIPAPGAILLTGIGTALVGMLRRRKAV